MSGLLQFLHPTLHKHVRGTARKCSCMQVMHLGFPVYGFLQFYCSTGGGANVLRNAKQK